MKKRHLIVPIVALCITSNVYAITSNDVTYNNDGTTENLTTTLDNLNSELKKYKTGGSVEANQMLEGATGYSKGELVTGTIKSKGEQTYTPGISNQTIDAGVYLGGAQTIKGDANLVAGNIAKGKSIFGVSGTYTSDANATAANILSGKTAYVNGSKVTGTIGSKAAATYTPGTSNQTIAAGQYLSGVQTIKGDANLTAANIAKGKKIFGVTGTYTSDATASASAILSGYTAYVNGSKVTGTHQARNHMPNLVWWDIWTTTGGEVMSWNDFSYTFPDNTAVTLVLGASREEENLTSSNWTTNVYLDGVLVKKDFSMKDTGTTWEGLRTWIFSAKKGQTVTAKITLAAGTAGHAKTLVAYMFGTQDSVSTTGFDTAF